MHDKLSNIFQTMVVQTSTWSNQGLTLQDHYGHVVILRVWFLLSISLSCTYSYYHEIFNLGLYNNLCCYFHGCHKNHYDNNQWHNTFQRLKMKFEDFLV